MMRSREQRCIPLELLDRRDWPLYSFSQRFLTPLCASSARLMASMMVLLAEEEGFPIWLRTNLWHLATNHILEIRSCPSPASRSGSMCMCLSIV